MIEKSEIFLGKFGKSYGPFTSEEYDQMHTSGKISDFTWIWESKNQIWKPIELPPHPPGTVFYADAKGNGKVVNWELIQAVCFDRFSLVSGKIQCPTESGCTLISHQKEDGLKFVIRSVVDLNLYDGASKQSTSTHASVIGVNYAARLWHYQLRWSSVPKFPKFKD